MDNPTPTLTMVTQPNWKYMDFDPTYIAAYAAMKCGGKLNVGRKGWRVFAAVVAIDAVASWCW